MTEAEQAQPQSVRTRRVLYVPGYDPVPPRKYRERYRTQSAKQAGLSGYEIALSKPQGDGRFGWHVSAEMDGQTVETEIEVLYWADIVRSSMQAGVTATYGQLARTAWIYLSTGALFRLARLRKGPVIAVLYPVLVLLGQALVAGVLAYLVFLSLSFAFDWMMQAIGAASLDDPFQAFRPIALLGGLAIGSVFLRWCAKRDHLYAWYLMKDYAFSAQHWGAYPDAQEARMRDFAGRVAAALAEEVDEVLVVGHSSGAYIAVSVLADLVRDERVGPDGPALSLLTLGHVVPMVSVLPAATRLRADLGDVSSQTWLNWVDITAPGDGCSFALCDPVAVSGMGSDAQTGPLVLSAAFTQTLRPETWAKLRWQLFETHFQYLNAFDNLPDAPGAYDYFRITAGPLTLAEHFATRSPSPGRITRSVLRAKDLV